MGEKCRDYTKVNMRVVCFRSILDNFIGRTKDRNWSSFNKDIIMKNHLKDLPNNWGRISKEVLSRVSIYFIYI